LCFEIGQGKTAGQGREMIKYRLYRLLMKIAHKYNWHYAPPCYPDGDTMLWCRWCGFRAVITKRNENGYLEGK
jgi:hypothetical protein